jgi:methionyl aminopeptidase
METKEINAYKKAGAVWAGAIKLAQKKCKEGKNLLELAHEVEALVKEDEAENAFPINLSINEEAAHYTPKFCDTYSLKESDVLKIDIGVSVEGYICDGAVTVNLDNMHAKQIEANELALKNAITKAEFGKPVEAIGAEIERTLKEKGFNPVYNLGGHGLGKNDIHSKPSIPNHSNGPRETLKECALAIEPFASTGKGHVSEVQSVEIFSQNEGKNVRNPFARKILEFTKKFEGKPFAERWIREEMKGKISELQIGLSLKDLMKTNCFHTYPGLKETKGTIVTQTEKSLLILEKGTIVLGE